MKKILESIIKNLVQNADAVSIEEIPQDSETKYEVRVDANDIGRVIGKRGRVAQSIRTVMKAVAAKENKKIVIEFID